MSKVYFHNRFSSYILVAAFGIVGGLLVAFFSQFPTDDLWGLAFFSSQTFGFWMCTTSLIALFSSKNFVAGINSALYVYLMFYVTGIFKRLAVYQHGYNTWQYFMNSFWQELAYGAIPAIVCGVLGFVLWYGRKKKVIPVIMRFAPALFIAAETVMMFIGLITRGQMLFMTIIDTVCLVLYILIICRKSEFGK